MTIHETHELKAPENFRARRFWDSLLTIACVLAFLLFIFFLVDGFNSIPVK